ncbi:uncharacterized protein LOC134214959 [Armigeres subalbatus]|uniref:uncharacterized protein LOC134214959 n=1 Tax=Armigeres subalbatus TaxID=124917 RepID=UPI002ECFC732
MAAIMASHTQLKDSLQNQTENLSLVVWSVAKISGWIAAVLKMLLIALLREPIEAIRKFIKSNGVNSGDDQYDEIETRSFNQYAITMIKIIICITLVQFVFMSVPNSAANVAFALPPELSGTGRLVSNVLRWLTVPSIPLAMNVRVLSNSITVGVLLLGMRAKLRMLAHRYEQMLNLPSMNADYYLQQVKATQDQQRKYWRLLIVLKRLVGKTFALAHYFAIFSIGLFVYTAKISGINIFSISIAIPPSLLLLEYYFLCRLVDTYQDEAASIGDLIFELCIKIPYSRDNHSEYVQTRTALMITWMNTQHGVSMDCFGLFEISTIAFVELVNTIYSVVAFLMQNFILFSKVRTQYSGGIRLLQPLQVVLRRIPLSNVADNVQTVCFNRGNRCCETLALVASSSQNLRSGIPDEDCRLLITSEDSRDPWMFRVVTLWRSDGTSGISQN